MVHGFFYLFYASALHILVLKLILYSLFKIPELEKLTLKIDRNES